jgi:hypothetical protein
MSLSNIRYVSTYLIEKIADGIVWEYIGRISKRAQEEWWTTTTYFHGRVFDDVRGSGAVHERNGWG